MADTGIEFTAKIDASRTPEQQGEECRRAYEETKRNDEDELRAIVSALATADPMYFPGIAQLQLRARAAVAELATPPRRITGEPPGWEGTRALHERHVAPLQPWKSR